MLNSIFRLGETRPEQKWFNGMAPDGTEFPEFLVEWKAPQEVLYFVFNILLEMTKKIIFL